MPIPGIDFLEANLKVAVFAHPLQLPQLRNDLIILLIRSWF